MNERPAGSFPVRLLTNPRKLDLLAVAIIIAGFAVIAAQSLATTPLPDTDESMTLQVPYEMLHHGKLALPMYRYLGGNIENVWHSYTPVFFILLSGFLKLFGWGLAQGRAFNILTAGLIVLLVHLIGRRLFDWRAGLSATLLLISDPTFLDRSRIIRNDYSGALFGLVAFYLYELATHRKQGRLYVAAGLAAGAGVMCHTNLLYIVAAIGTLMWLRHGRRVLREKSVYQFAGGSLAVMAPEIVYDLLDYRNFLLQNRQDEMHFNVLSIWGWLSNLREEITRYESWYNGYLKINAPLILLHGFLWLTAAAAVYLLVRSALQLRKGRTIDEPRVRLLVTMFVITMFFAIVTQRKVVLYVVHLAPWFALACGVLLGDGFRLMARLRVAASLKAKLAFGFAMVALAGAIGFYGFHFVRQNRDYFRSLNDPHRATFDELAGVLREVVTGEVCPVGIKQGVLWLAFPERDRCFAAIENRMLEALDIRGNEYAVIASTRRNKKEGRLIAELTNGSKLIAELKRTAYGGLSVYYTGTDPAFLSRVPERYFFFGRERGYFTEKEIEAAREVWSANDVELRKMAPVANPITSPGGLVIQQSDGDFGTVRLATIEVAPMMIYQVIIDASNKQGRWEAVITEEQTSRVLYRGRVGQRDSTNRFEEVFKTNNSPRITLSLRRAGSEAAGLIAVTRVSLREVAHVCRTALN